MNTTAALPKYEIRPIRWPVVNHYLRVFHDNPRKPVGHVLDIHETGIRLQSAEPISDDKEILLSMEVTISGGKFGRISFAGLKRWSKKNIESGYSETGFSVAWPEEAQPLVEKLIADIQKSEKMDLPDVEVAVYRYQDALQTLSSTSTQAQVFNVLRSRDSVHNCMKNGGFQAKEMLAEIHLQDQKLRQWSKKNASKVNFEQWRKSLNPSAESWWWHLDRSRDWVWDLLPIPVVIVALYFIFDILPKFIPIETKSLLIIITLASSFVAYLHSIMKGRMIWMKGRFFLTVIILLIAAGTYGLKPKFSNSALSKGITRFNEKNQQDAFYYLNKALVFNPENNDARFFLGYLYEESNQMEKARSEYQTVFFRSENSKDRCRAANKLAYEDMMVNGAYENAYNKLVKCDPPAGEHYLKFCKQRNLGFSLFGQEKFAEAKVHLDHALDIEIDRDKSNVKSAEGFANCLRARVLEKMDSEKKEICECCTECLEKFQARSSEERDWYNWAQNYYTSSNCDKMVFVWE